MHFLSILFVSILFSVSIHFHVTSDYKLQVYNEEKQIEYSLCQW